MAPFIETERRVGGDDIKQYQVAVFIQKFGVTNGVAPFDFVVVFTVQEHVHFRQRPGRADGFLPVEGVFLTAVVGDDFAATFH